MLWILCELIKYIIQRNGVVVLEAMLGNNLGNSSLLRVLVRACKPGEDNCFKFILTHPHRFRRKNADRLRYDNDRGVHHMENPLIEIFLNSLVLFTSMSGAGVRFQSQTLQEAYDDSLLLLKLCESSPKGVVDIVKQIAEEGNDMIKHVEPEMFLWSTDKVFASMLTPFAYRCSHFLQNGSICKKSVFDEISSDSHDLFNTFFNLLKSAYNNTMGYARLSSVIVDNIVCVYRLACHHVKAIGSSPTIACYWQHTNVLLIQNRTSVLRTERELTAPPAFIGRRAAAAWGTPLPRASLVDLTLWSLDSLVQKYPKILDHANFPCILSHVKDAVMLLVVYGSRLTDSGLQHCRHLLQINNATFGPLLDAYLQVSDTKSRSVFIQVMKAEQTAEEYINHKTPLCSLQELVRLHILEILGTTDVIARVERLSLPLSLKLYLLPYLNKQCHGPNPLQLDFQLCN